MADELDALNRKFEELTKTTSKYKRTLDTSILTIIKDEKDTKRRNKLVQEYSKLLKSQIDTEEKRKKLNSFQLAAIEQQIDTTEELGISNTKLGKIVNIAAKEMLGLAKGVGKTALKFADGETRINGMKDAMTEFSGYIGKGGKFLAEVGDFNAGIYKTLAMSGADFGKSVIDLRRAAGDARMPILDFVDLIQGNSRTFSSLFGTVNSSTASVAAFASSVRDLTMKEFNQFGLNFQETAEYMNTFLEIERARGRQQQMTQAELINGTRGYVKNLLQLSRLTGQNVDEIDKEVRARAVDGQFQAKLAKLSAEERDRLIATNAALSGMSPAFGQFFRDIVNTGTVTTEANQMIAGISGELYNTIKRYVDDPSFSQADLISQVRKEGAEILQQPGLEIAAAFDPLIGGVLDVGAAVSGITQDLDGKRIDLQTVLQKELDQRTEFTGFTKELIQILDSLGIMKTGLERTSTTALASLAGGGEFLAQVNKTLQGIGSLGLRSEDILAGVLDMPRKALRVINAGGEKLTEFLFKGADGKGFMENTFDNDPNTPGIQVFGKPNREYTSQRLTPEQKNAFSGYQYGTMGTTGRLFENFGTGTPAMLHGEEAVIPKESMFGNLLTALTRTTESPAMATQTSNSTISVPELNELNQTASKLYSSSEKMERALNTLVTIGAMTEKNTKNFNNNLANMGGSLV